jgi:hypothetical protein
MKARKDSTLKARAEQSEDFGDKVFAWINEPKTEKCIGGVEYAKAQLAADGIKTSETALRDFYSWWGLRVEFKQADQDAENVKELLKEIHAGLTSEQLEEAGQIVFTRRALAQRDQEKFVEIGRFKLDKDSAKTKGRQKEEELTLKKEKFARDTGALFLKWLSDKRMMDIANSNLSNAEKIEQMRLDFYKDIDALQASGEIVIPR